MNGHPDDRPDAAAIAKAIMGGDPADDVLSEWDRDITGRVVQIRIPFRDSVEVMECVKLIEAACATCREIYANSKLKERSRQFQMRLAWKEVHKVLAKRTNPNYGKRRSGA